ncbi:MAG: peptidylprolyl isomerase [Candidatus Omnitrophota bacterium]|jgi:parvulin-like peptidyl-prolyl isomerase
MMKKIAFIFLFVAIIFAVSVSHSEVIDRIVAVVNNEVITQREIDGILEPIYEQYRSLYYGDELIKKLEEARQKVLDQLIEDRLILSEAKKLNVEVEEAAVDARVDDMVRRFPSREAFERALAQQDINLKDLRARYKEQIMVRRLIDHKVGSKISVSPPEIANFYDKHANEFVQPEQIKLSNILIRPKKNMTMDQAERLANEIESRLREGGSFEGLAMEYSEGPNASEGGSMGYVKKGDLLPAIEEVVFELKEGEVSPIIKTNLGFHIFKIDEKRERKVLELSEVRRDVEEAVFREKIKGRIKDWVDGLKKNAYIAYK